MKKRAIKSNSSTISPIQQLAAEVIESLTPEQEIRLENEDPNSVENQAKQQQEQEELEEKLASEFDQELRDRYDHYLLETYNIIDIEGAEFLPSYILQELDPSFYKQALSEFKEREDQETREKIVNEYPTPIAYHYYKATDPLSDSKTRFESLKDTWETLIHFIYALALSEFRFRRYSLLLRKSKPTKPFQAMTLEDFCSWQIETKLIILQKLYSLVEEKGYILACRDLISPKLIQRMRELNTVRNQEYAHIASLSPMQAAEKLNKYLPEVTAILRDANEFENLKILRFERADKSMTDPIFKVFNGWTLATTSYSKKLTPSQYQTSSSVINIDNILIEHSDNLYSISPWLHFCHSDHGHTIRLCLLKKDLDFEIIGQSQHIRISHPEFPMTEAQFNNHMADILSLLQAGGIV